MHEFVSSYLYENLRGRYGIMQRTSSATTNSSDKQKGVSIQKAVLTSKAAASKTASADKAGANKTAISKASAQKKRTTKTSRVLSVKQKHHGKMRKLFASIAACACVIALATVAIAAYAEPLNPDYTWYKGHETESEYKISTASQMLALSNLVNGTAVLEEGKAAVDPVTFANKTITLTSTISFFGYDSGLPCIGGQNGTVFAGTFDGAGNIISGCTLLTAENAKSNIGLFGACTAESTIKNIKVTGMDLNLSLIHI